jgi:hypothetical protein
VLDCSLRPSWFARVIWDVMRKSELVEFHERVGRPVSAIGRERDYSVTENPVC